MNAARTSRIRNGAGSEKRRFDIVFVIQQRVRSASSYGYRHRRTSEADPAARQDVIFGVELLQRIGLFCQVRCSKKSKGFSTIPGS